MTTLTFLLEFIIFSSLILPLAFLLMIRPGLAIEIQRRFYEKINWKIEPISMPKEIRNTRIMGWFLLLIDLLIISCVMMRKI